MSIDLLLRVLTKEALWTLVVLALIAGGAILLGIWVGRHGGRR